MKINSIVRYLEKLKKENPNQTFIVETPNGSIEFKIGDALIYDDHRGTIIIDTE